jgi:hypothetical protein
VQGRGQLRRDLSGCLRTGRAVRRPRRRRRPDQRGGRISDMISISERPAEAVDRAVPGHWEGDLILGATAKSAIGTLVERTTRFVMLLHLPDDHGALAVQDAIVDKMAQLPATLRRTLTWDRGSEMANHVAIADAARGTARSKGRPWAAWQAGRLRRWRRAVYSPRIGCLRVAQVADQVLLLVARARAEGSTVHWALVSAMSRVIIESGRTEFVRMLTPSPPSEAISVWTTTFACTSR